MISSAERDFSSYGCLIVPALYSASEDLLTAISDYVKNGGHLITTFRSGFSDEQLKIYADTQPHILQECLGIHYDQYTYPVDVSVTLPDFMAHPSCSGHENAASDAGSSCSDESCTNSSKCLHWMDLVTCDTATPLFFYDHPVWKNMQLPQSTSLEKVRHCISPACLTVLFWKSSGSLLCLASGNTFSTSGMPLSFDHPGRCQ